MARQAVVRNEFVSAEDIDSTKFRCPRESCQSATLVLYGTSQFSRMETMENDETTSVKVDESTHAFEIETIECLACGTRWHVKTREVTALERKNQELRQLVIALTGQDPYGVGKGN